MATAPSVGTDRDKSCAPGKVRVGQILWTLRPGSRAKHADLASIPLRNDELPQTQNEHEAPDDGA
ncbi:MAG: cbb3-type cytochrome c oxidase subunit 3 [Pseudomonadota bacterium]